MAWITWAEKSAYPPTAYTSVGFVYDGVYTVPPDLERAFAAVGRELTPILIREEVILWKRWRSRLSRQHMSKDGMSWPEGWAISTHHNLNLNNQNTLFKGNGATSSE